MNNKRIIDYVMQSPNNTNPAVLESMLKAIIGDGGGLTAMTATKNGDSWSSYPTANLGETMYRLFDTVPPIERLSNAKLIIKFNDDVFEGGFFEAQLYPVGDNPNDGVFCEDGIVGGLLNNKTVFGGFETAEIAAQFGAEVGLYFPENLAFIKRGMFVTDVKIGHVKSVTLTLAESGGS